MLAVILIRVILADIELARMIRMQMSDLRYQI